MKTATKRARTKRAAKRVEPLYALRTVAANGTSHNGFKWPAKIGAVVEAPDWEPVAECGHGLHGLRDGRGDGSLLSWADDAIWQIVEVDQDAGLVEISGKIKFRRCTLVLSGNREDATGFLVNRGLVGVVGAMTTAGYGGTATAGDRGTATAGDRGTATAGDRGTATAGDRGTATAGYRGTATAGYGGTATAGDRGTATAGDRGTATAGYGGTATAGYRGTIVCSYWDSSKGRRRLVVGYIGEDGIQANVKYQLNAGFELVEVK